MARKKTSSITIRMDSPILHALKMRAALNERSANREIVSILKAFLNNEKAPEPRLGNRSDASE
ncbi:hypothetical protein [Neokomagataea anthophila]|uniref:Arc family DNA-binding protein n=1 Tax=Neokomagataea anthophila TaxID=2826925 RepID=A0ABS5E800_9PROT|nr:hypothetical protein [Neokomagataea anthophila]MBR0560040.1 hypothetical protein [Neokomagataea anthophila]